MAAVPFEFRGTLYDLLSKSAREVFLSGVAYRSDLGVGGGPILPPDNGKPPFDPNARPEHPIFYPPGTLPHPEHPIYMPGPHPEHPIVIPQPPTDIPTPPTEGKPPPPNGGWGWSPEYGWGYFPGPTQPGPKA